MMNLSRRLGQNTSKLLLRLRRHSFFQQLQLNDLFYLGRQHTPHRPHSTLSGDKNFDAFTSFQGRHTIVCRKTLQLYNSLTNQVQPVLDDPRNNIEPSKGLACYTCGPTTYAPSHLGHARTYVWLDILRRTLEQQAIQLSQPAPLFVMNITDVDDKILQAAAAVAATPLPTTTPATCNADADADTDTDTDTDAHVEAAKPENSDPMSFLQLARHFEGQFWQDLDDLNCIRPHIVTRVSEYVESDIVPYIQTLIDGGMAYTIEKDGVYFDTQAYEKRRGIHAKTRHGNTFKSSANQKDVPHNDDETNSTPAIPSHPPITELNSNKRDVRDFALWKNRKSGESAYWESPWGTGRPGWHIECSSMIQSVQTQFARTHKFALHAGGIDLQFPHHTNEIVQAEAYHDCCNSDSSLTTRNTTLSHVSNNAGIQKENAEWIPHWVHTGQLRMKGLKMSKSLKNFITIREWFNEATSDLTHPNALQNRLVVADEFRLWCLGLSGSYRGVATFSRARMQESRSVREKIVRFLLQGEEWLRRQHGNDGDFEKKKYREVDHLLLTDVQDAASLARRALLTDLDGTTYVKQLLLIAENGTKYIQQQREIKSETGPIEPLRSSLDLLRNLLSQVGFSDATCWAGSIEVLESTDNGINRTTDLISEIIKFRSSVRRAALDEKRIADSPSENIMNILSDCDNLRLRLPAFGVELLDASISQAEVKDDWRFCVPQSQKMIEQLQTDREKPTKSEVKRFNPFVVAAEDLFRADPHYKELFSKFNDDGVPILKRDGSIVSNTQQKKFQKKLRKHAKLWRKMRKLKANKR